MPSNPFESCSSVLKMTNPKHGKSGRQEKMIVAESFCNLMILAGYLDLIQSKAFKNLSRFHERKIKDNKLLKLI